jgi:hypothetical protein
MGWGWNPFDDVMQASHDVNQGLSDTLGKIPGFNRVMGWLNKPYQMLLSHPVSAFFTFVDNEMYKEDNGQSAPLSDLFSGEAWSKAWQNSNNISPGQAITLGLNGVINPGKGEPDPYNQVAREQFFQNNSFANFVSGGIDAGLRTVDPVNIAMKKATRPVQDGLRGTVKATSNIDEMMANRATQRFVQRVPQMTFQQLAQHPILAASGARYKAASLLSIAKTPEEAGTLMRIGMGDEKAYNDFMSDKQTVAANQAHLDDLDRNVNPNDQLGLPQSVDPTHSINPNTPVTGDIGGTLSKTLAQMRVAQVMNNMDLNLKSNFLDLDPQAMAQFTVDSGKIVTEHANKMLQDNADLLSNVDDIYQQLRNRTKASVPSERLADLKASLATRVTRSDGSPFRSGLDTPTRVQSIIRSAAMDPMVRIYQTLSEPSATRFVDFTRDDSVGVVRAMLNTFPSVDQATRDDLLQRYAGASRADRQVIYNQIERKAVSMTAARYGITPATAEAIYRETATRRGAYLEQAKSRAYGTIQGAKGNRVGASMPITDSGQVVVDPYVEGQLARGALPAMDGRTLDLALSRMNDAGITRVLHHAGENTHRITLEMLDRVYGLWKPLVLLTGHRVYNHVGDDFLRSMAKVGALATAQNARDGVGNFMRNRISSVTKAQKLRTLQGEWDTRINQSKAELKALQARYKTEQEAVAAGVMQTGSVTLDDISAAKRDLNQLQAAGPPMVLPKHRIGTGTMKVPGTNIEFPELFGGPDGDYNRRIFGSDATFQTMLNEKADDDFDNVQLMSDHDIITPRDGVKPHANALLRYVRNQLAPDPVAKKILRGVPDNEIRDWMLKTPEGRARMRALHIGDPMENIDMIHDQIDKYLPTERARAAAAANSFTMKTIDTTWPAASSRPEVAGNIGLLAHGGAPSVGYIKHYTQKLIKFTGSLPDDILVRHPLANTLYKTNFSDVVQSRIAQGHEDTFTVDELNTLRKAAITQTRTQMQKLLYDTSTFSSFGSTVRFMSPFFNAWHNAMGAWTSLIAQNPSLVLRGYQAKQALWNNPASIDMTTGLPANDKTPLSNLAIVTHMPGPLANFLGLKDMNFIPISVSKVISPTYADSIGNPGWGPLVVAPVNALVKRDPSLINNPFAQQILGGRITQNDLQSFVPSVAGQLSDVLHLGGVTGSADDVATRAKLEWSLWQEQMYDYTNGKGPEPNWNDIEKQASWLDFMTMIAGRALPLGFTTDPNHQFLIDEYKRMEGMDPKNAQQDFWDKYGNAGFVFTQSLSKNSGGIAATPGAIQAYKRHESLIKKYPELAALVVGPNGDGNFNDMAFQWETANGLRTYMTPQEAASMEQTNLGWAQYNKIMANLNYQVAARGLTSIKQTGAKDLRQARDAFVAATGDSTSKYYNPDFYSSYGSFNQNAYNARIQAIEKIAADPALQADYTVRSEIASLNYYFQLRDQARAYLSGRKSKSLTASSNSDVANWFDYGLSLRMQQDTKFQGIYERFLKHDDLSEP